jgi:hypothetical protein
VTGSGWIDEILFSAEAGYFFSLAHTPVHQCKQRDTTSVTESVVHKNHRRRFHLQGGAQMQYFTPKN